MRSSGARVVVVRLARVSLTLCLLLSCAAGAFAQEEEEAAARGEAVRKLLAFEGRDLRELDEESRKTIADLARRLVPDKQDAESFAARFRAPQLVKRVGSRGQAVVVMLDAQTFVMSPGQAFHCLYFFDEAGALRGSSEFSTGWRMSQGAARIVEQEGLGVPVLEMWASGLGVFAHARTLRQHYALLGDRAVLVRLEDGEGQLVANVYGCQYATVGPPVPRRTADEWAKSLASEDKVELLQTLTWLGGQHQTGGWPPEGSAPRKAGEAAPAPEDAKDKAPAARCRQTADEARLVGVVRGRDDVRRALARLAASGDEWARQAAEAALKPPGNL